MSDDRPREERQPTYIYIAARGHSGSTLLTLLLARHPQVVAVGELANLSLQMSRDESTRWVGQCSCGERPADCPMWGQVLGEISDENNVDLVKHPFKWKISDVGMEEEFRRLAPIRAPLVWARNRFWRMWRYVQYLSPKAIRPIFEWYKPQKVWAKNRSTLAEKIATTNKVSVIVDASKDPLDMLDVYENAELPVKMIHLTRDSRGNIWSMMKRMKDSDNRKDVVARAAHDWAKVNRRIWRFVQRVPERDYMHIHYEEMCRDPETVMAQLFEFVGLPPCEVLAATESSDGESDQGHTIGGNRIRFTSEKLTIREDTVWKEKLTAQDLEIIERVAGPMSRQLGYKH